MKKNLLGSMAFVVAMGLALGACSNELKNVADKAQSVASRSVAEGLAPTVEEGFGYTEHTLWAGQHIDAGSVFVYNDYEKLYVTYQTNAPWEIQEAHLFVGKAVKRSFIISMPAIRKTIRKAISPVLWRLLPQQKDM